MHPTPPLVEDSRSDDAATDEYQHPELFSVEKLRELFGPDYRRYLREGAETYIGDLPEGVDQATGDVVWFPPDRTLGSQAVPPGQQTEPWTMPTSSTFWRPKSGMSIRAFITVLLVVVVVAISNPSIGPPPSSRQAFPCTSPRRSTSKAEAPSARSLRWRAELHEREFVMTLVCFV